MTAAAIRQRLRDGDLQVGDRVVVTIVSDSLRRDTVVVRSGRTLELRGMVVVPVAGVLRSELQERVATEVRKYIKAQQVEVTPLMRVGILGAVARPGYFAFASDLPLTDAIMGAGGPTANADMGRSSVRRRNQEYRSSGETSQAIANGLTLDQFGLAAGDELVVGQSRGLGASAIIGMAGALASVLALVVAMHR
jgi:protein involved in polysaccharide export with SLBB domain